MKKPGQPDSALELTAGRKSLLGQLRYGVADRAMQSMAANWLRDLTVHHGESLRRLEVNAAYCALMTGTLNNAVQQSLAVDWIESLLFTAKENSVTEDELIAQGQRETLPANSMQVGGDHYQKPIQHWDFAATNGYDYLLGQVTKYLFRWRDKNGLQDVEKAAHFLQKAGEVATAEDYPLIPIHSFLDVNNIKGDERALFLMLHAYHDTNDPVYLIEAERLMLKVLALAGGTPRP